MDAVQAGKKALPTGVLIPSGQLTLFAAYSLL